VSLTWTIDTERGVSVVHLAGRLTLGPQLQRFSREMTALLCGNTPAGLLLDMAGVAEIDSAGLGELVVLYTTAGQNSCALCLVAPAHRVTKLLEITQLSQLFPQFPETSAGLSWLRKHFGGGLAPP
jgi:anti-anti-sigma factor